MNISKRFLFLSTVACLSLCTNNGFGMKREGDDLEGNSRKKAKTETTALSAVQAITLSDLPLEALSNIARLMNDNEHCAKWEWESDGKDAFKIKRNEKGVAIFNHGSDKEHMTRKDFLAINNCEQLLELYAMLFIAIQDNQKREDLMCLLGIFDLATNSFNSINWPFKLSPFDWAFITNNKEAVAIIQRYKPYANINIYEYEPGAGLDLAFVAVLHNDALVLGEMLNKSPDICFKQYRAEKEVLFAFAIKLILNEDREIKKLKSQLQISNNDYFDCLRLLLPHYSKYLTDPEKATTILSEAVKNSDILEMMLPFCNNHILKDSDVIAKILKNAIPEGVELIIEKLKSDNDLDQAFLDRGAASAIQQNACHTVLEIFLKNGANPNFMKSFDSNDYSSIGESVDRSLLYGVMFHNNDYEKSERHYYCLDKGQALNDSAKKCICILLDYGAKVLSDDIEYANSKCLWLVDLVKYYTPQPKTPIWTAAHIKDSKQWECIVQ